MTENDELLMLTVRYLDGTEEERVCPTLASFLKKAEKRLSRRGLALVFGNGNEALPLIIESWLVANPNEQPLWPKDGGPVLREPMDVFGASLPEWQKRKWV